MAGYLSPVMATAGIGSLLVAAASEHQGALGLAGGILLLLAWLNERRP